VPENISQILQELWNSLQVLITGKENLKIFQGVVQWSAILLSALAGTYAARKRGMDFFGVLVIAFVSCVGGGTIRDLLLGRFPIFWLASPIYMVTILIVGLFGFLIQREAEKGEKYVGQIAQPIERMVGENSMAFTVIDSLALGLWAYLGTFFALGSGVSPFLAPVLGVITAIFGGVLRDVFFAKIPTQFLPGQIYATAAAIGAVVYVVLYSIGQGGAFGFIACIAVTFIVRMASVKFNITSS